MKLLALAAGMAMLLTASAPRLVALKSPTIAQLETLPNGQYELKNVSIERIQGSKSLLKDKTGTLVAFRDGQSFRDGRGTAWVLKNGDQLILSNVKLEAQPARHGEIIDWYGTLPLLFTDKSMVRIQGVGERVVFTQSLVQYRRGPSELMDTSGKYWRFAENWRSR